jgi:aromatic-amino-acid transaminase
MKDKYPRPNGPNGPNGANDSLNSGFTDSSSLLKPSFPERLRGWAALPRVEEDEIFGVDAAFKRDPRPVVRSRGVPIGEGKVNLAIGAFVNDSGALHICDAITAARGRRHRSDGMPSPYLNQIGYGPFIDGVNRLIYGRDSGALRDGRVATVQSVGGGNALYMGGLLYRDSLGGSTPQICLPVNTWANHPKIFGRLGFVQRFFNDYDRTNRAFNGEALIDAVGSMEGPTLLLLQPSCPNPTGNRPSDLFWRTLCKRVRERSDQGVDITVFFDVAYQGFGRGIEEDIEPVRMFNAADIPTMTAWSGSKSFSLYGARVGALSVVGSSPQEATLIQANLCEIVRALQSNCPRDGAELVGDVLSDEVLFDAWGRDLARLRSYLRQNRTMVAAALEREIPGFDTQFIRHGEGFFNQLGLEENQLAGLRSDGIYMPMQGRIAFPLFSPSNADYFARCLAAHLRA